MNDKVKAHMALVEEYAGDYARATTENLYGTSKSYTKQCFELADEARAAVEASALALHAEQPEAVASWCNFCGENVSSVCRDRLATRECEMGLPKMPPLAAAPTTEFTSSSDAERLDWLCTQYVTVRTPLRYGSRECFLGSPTDQDGESPEPWDIRAAIDAAIATKGGKL